MYALVNGKRLVSTHRTVPAAAKAEMEFQCQARRRNQKPSTRIVRAVKSMGTIQYEPLSQRESEELDRFIVGG